MTDVRVFTETNITPERWMQDAPCGEVDPDLFFPEHGVGSREVAAARAVCAGCGVAAQCLAFALGNNIRDGFWGGLSPRERARLRRAS